MDEVAGNADAQDPQIVVGETPVDQEDPRIELERSRVIAEKFVEKVKAHLAGAEEALRQAEEALEAFDGGRN